MQVNFTYVLNYTNQLLTTKQLAKIVELSFHQFNKKQHFGLLNVAGKVKIHSKMILEY